MKIRITGGRVIDPSRSIDEINDIFVSDGVLIDSPTDLSKFDTLDATGLWVVPGLIDAHVHLREPGGEQKEDIASGLAAAAAGGFTAVMPMPNTSPTIDSVSLTQMMIDRADALGGTRIYPVPAVTVDRKGEALTPMADLKAAGAVAFSDDGTAVVDDDLMRAALEICAELKVPLCQHAEDPDLSAGGILHAGDVSSKLGVKGWPALAEERIVARDIALCEDTGGHLHVSHISTRGSVEMVRKAKARGLRVTAEVTPHHLLLTDETAVDHGTNAKVNPPLRTEKDRLACVAGLADGTIDMVATDHAPHTLSDKQTDWGSAAFGLVGLEIAVPLLLKFVEDRTISPMRLVEAMSTAPASVFSLQAGTLAPGSPADITLIAPASPHVIDPQTFRSKGRNTPFVNWRVPGRVVRTIVRGHTAFSHPLLP